MSSKKPVPPASTTPASFRTWSISGVRASASAPPARAASATSSSETPPASSAASALPRVTVRIVPSTGRITAP